MSKESSSLRNKKSSLVDIWAYIWETNVFFLHLFIKDDSRSLIELPHKDGTTLSSHKAGAVDSWAAIFCAWKKCAVDIKINQLVTWMSSQNKKSMI